MLKQAFVSSTDIFLDSLGETSSEEQPERREAKE